MLLRPHLGKLAARLVELSLPGGTKATFANELEAAQKQEEAIVQIEGRPIPPEKLAIPSIGIERFIELAHVSPEGAVLESFKVLETIPETFKDRIPPHRRSISAVVSHLHTIGALEYSWVDLFTRIRKLRNYAVHANAGQPITPGEAIEFQSLCRLLSDKLFDVFRNLPPDPLSA